MARRSFAVVDVTEILIHWHAGRSKSEVAVSLGVHRETVAKYVARAEAEGLVPGGPPLAAEQWAALVRVWFPELVDPDLRHPRWARIAPFHDRIKAGLEINTATTVWQRLRDEDGLDVSITTFRRYLYAHLPEEVARAQVTVRRDDPPPGQEAQIDYGFLGRWVDPVTGRARRVWAFVMVLAASRHLFVRPVLSMNLAGWVAAHVAAWEFFGGVTARLVPDNLRNGVLKPDLYDPKFNRTYAELAVHYGTLIDPARAGRPTDKPRVENPMPYVRDSFWRGREFSSEAAMQAAATRWCREVAGKRHCRPLDGASPLAVFEAVEAAQLLALPAQPFELVRWSTPKVGPDIHAKVGRTLYSIPWRFLGRRVDARESNATVEFFVDGELVKTHPRTEKGKQTDWGDYPPEKVAFFMRTPAWCRHRAGEIGPSCAALIAELLEINALYRLRSAQGVLGLAERHSPPRVEAACRRALEVGDASYRTVKGILAAGTEGDTTEQTRAPLAPAHLHGPSRLFQLGEAAS
jgi:transposase